MRVGQYVVLRNPDGSLAIEMGVGHVTSSDISRVVADFGEILLFNAGTLKHDDWTLSEMTQEDERAFHAAARAIEREKLNARKISDLRCGDCYWWRPPFDSGPGNCHNEDVARLTAVDGKIHPPPTPAHFGCVQWESKDQPENGEE